MSSENELTLEQMMLEMSKSFSVELRCSGGDNQWKCTLGKFKQDGNESWLDTKWYVANTPMGAVVQAYRDR